MRAAGAVVEVATGLDAALATLESWGLLRGRAAIGRATQFGFSSATQAVKGVQ